MDEFLRKVKRHIIRSLGAESIGFTGQVKWQKTKNGILVAESPWMDNIVLANDARGVYIALDRLVGINTYTLNVTHADIGDSATTPTSADTGCGNALERASIGAVSRSALTADFRFFYPDALTTNDTYEEFAMIIDGTATLGTGRAFNHLKFSTPMVKTAGEDHTIVCRITASV